MRAGKKESIGVLIGAMAEAESKSFLYREKGIYQSKGNLGELEKGHGCPCRGYCEAGRS